MSDYNNRDNQVDFPNPYNEIFEDLMLQGMRGRPPNTTDNDITNSLKRERERVEQAVDASWDLNRWYGANYESLYMKQISAESDADFVKGWKQGVHEALTSLLDVLEYTDLVEEHRWIADYMEMRRRRHEK